MKITLDAREAVAQYNAAFQLLRELPGFDHREVLRAEAGSILKRWAGITKVATEDNLLKGARLRAVRGLGLNQTSGQADPAVTINSGARRRSEPGMIWVKRTPTKNWPNKFSWAGKVYPETGRVIYTSRHLKDRAWAAAQAAATAYISEYPKAKEEVFGAQGMSRQSVVQIADDLKIDLASVKGKGIGIQGLAKARAAMAAGGTYYKNGFGSVGGDKVTGYIDLMNRLPYNKRIDMDMGLAEALSGRAQGIATAYKKGAMDSLQKAAKSFPNIIQLSNLNYEGGGI